MYAEWPEGVIFGRKFDLAEYAWLLPGKPRCELYITEQITENGVEGGINSTGYSNPEFDTTCDQAHRALYRVEALQRHQMAQKLFSDDLPSLPLFFHLRIGVARPELIGFSIDPTHPSPLWNIESLDLYDNK
jgi:peptide/nickel transport system substrate-binding protein